MSLLIGCHDRESAAIVPVGGWIVDTVSLAANEGPADFARLAPGRQIITRINWGYGSTGTIPTPDRYEAFAAQCAAYVQGSRGCTRWIVGNETNLTSVEAPQGQPIGPIDYARCFSICRQAIRRVQPNAEIIPAPIAPWSVESGDWLTYWQDMLAEINTRGGFDAIALHSYIHGNDPGLVNSDARMDAPYSDRYFQFNAYRDTLDVPVLANLQHLPAYLTEACPVDVPGWEARGIMPAMLANVDWWNNQPDTQKIQCCVFFRYPLYDKWGFADRPAVIAEFHAAAPHYRSPQPAQPLPSGPTVPVAPTSPLSPPLQWDSRLDHRGASLQRAEVLPGKNVYRLIRGEWLDEQQSQGKHHVFIDVLDESGQRMSGVAVSLFWPDGVHRQLTDTAKDATYSLDFPLWNRAPAYGVRIDGFSDEVSGLGLGSIEQPDHNIHTSYRFVFQRLPTPAVQPIPPTLETETNPVQPATAYVNAIAGLNLRKGPGTDHGVSDTLAHGTPVEIIGRQGDWLQTRTGWLHSAYISTTKPPVDPHIAPPPVQPVTPTQPGPSGIIDPLAGQAIIAIESGGQAFGPGNRLLIRFETHLFNRHTNNAHVNLFRHGSPPWTGQEWRKSGNDPWRQVHTGSQESEWAAFEHAATFNRNAAIMSCSLGLGQILGSHYRRLGYASAESMFAAFGDRRYGHATQMLGFLNFMLSDARLFQAMRNKDFLTVATIYNGPGQAQHYANLMDAEYRRLRGAG